MASRLLEERARRRTDLDDAISDEFDPTPAYLDFAQWMLANQPDDRAAIRDLFHEAIDPFKDDPAFQQNNTYLQLWFLYAGCAERPTDVFQEMVDKGIGVRRAQLFEEYAMALERVDDRAKADEVYRAGIRANARPTTKLKERYQLFLSGKMPPPPMSSRPSHPPTASSSTQSSHRDLSKATTSKGSSSRSHRPASSSSTSSSKRHTRYDYIRAHIKSGGAAEPGKRREHFRFNLGLLFTPDRIEYSGPEARARAEGLFGKKWPPVDPEPPFGSFLPAVAPTLGQGLLSPAELVPVDFARKKSASARLLSASEPTMTINTKEALADVFGMYNSPEKSVRSGAPASGSKHAPVRRVELPAALARRDENAAASRSGLGGVPLYPLTEDEDDTHGYDAVPMPPFSGLPPPSFKPLADGDIPYGGLTPAAARTTPFRPMVDENALATPAPMRTPCENSRPAGLSLKTPSAFSTVDENEGHRLENRTPCPPKAGPSELPLQTPSFRPFVDENAGATAPRANVAWKTPGPMQFKPFIDDKPTRTPLSAVPLATRTPLAPQMRTIPDVVDVESDSDAERESRREPEFEPSPEPTELVDVAPRGVSSSTSAPALTSAPAQAQTQIPTANKVIFSRSAVFTPRVRSVTQPGGDVFSAPTPGPSTDERRASSAKTEGASTSVSAPPALGLGAARPVTAAAATSFRVFRPPSAVHKTPTPAFKPQRKGPSADSDEVDAPPPPRSAAQKLSFAPLAEKAVVPAPEFVPAFEPQEAAYKDDSGQLHEHQPEHEDELQPLAGEDEMESYRPPLNGRFGDFNVMTPITERTLEWTATPSWRSNARRDSQDAVGAAERLAAELKQVEEEAEDGNEGEGEVLGHPGVGENTPWPSTAIRYDPASDLPPAESPHSVPLPPSSTPPPSSTGEPCNPFDPAVARRLLSALPATPDFHDCSDREAQQLVGLQRFAKRQSGPARKPMHIALLDRHYEITGKLGEGGFGAVFSAKEKTVAAGVANDSDSDSDDELDEESQGVALKVVRPRNLWEFHIIRRVHAALPARLQPSVIFPRALYAFQDESFLVLDLCKQGTLLDVVNRATAWRLSRHGALDELLVMFFAIELLRVLEGLHQAGFIHGDLKIDNCLVRLGAVPGDADAWVRVFDPSGGGGWAHKGITLIDFGRGIDTRLFPPGQTFVGDWPTDGRDCPALREGRAWTFETDYYGLAGIVYCMLFGKYMEQDAVVHDTAGAGRSARYKLGAPFKRYWQGDLWTALFDVLLNPAQVRADGQLPLCDELAALRGEMEAWLEANSERPGNSLQILLKRIEHEQAHA